MAAVSLRTVTAPTVTPSTPAGVKVGGDPSRERPAPENVTIVVAEAGMVAGEADRDRALKV